MHEIKGNLFDQKDADVICITTNGCCNKQGANIMGAGCAGEAKRLWPDIEYLIGEQISRYGNQVHRLTVPQKDGTPGFIVGGSFQEQKGGLPYHLFTFPTKPAICTYAALLPTYRKRYWETSSARYYPGWMAKSSLDIITHSAAQLVDLVNQLFATKQGSYDKVVIPQPGCGAGGLSWEDDVSPILRSILDNRFYTISF